jgi:thiamine biosynthesis lipoprotein
MTAGNRIRCRRRRDQRRSAGFDALCAALLGVVGASAAHAEWLGDSLDLMGTRVSVDLWADDEAGGRALVAAVLDEYRRIDAAMSTYKSTSELSLVNRGAAERPVPVSAELFALVGDALQLSTLSAGAFDITYESVGYLYDFRARNHPSRTEIDARLDAIDYRHVVLDDASRSIRFARPGVRVNLGGIAKGHAVERGADLLRNAGVRHAMLTAGGDTRVLGDRRGRPWLVGIRHPRVENEIVTRLPLVDEAISTSGDYERFFEEDGRRYHHIIDPATGEPTAGILSVTIIGPDATMTDGLSTTVFVLGAQDGLALIESLSDYEAIVVDASGQLSYSSGLEPGGN